jgi:hypothetical protein
VVGDRRRHLRPPSPKRQSRLSARWLILGACLLAAGAAIAQAPATFSKPTDRITVDRRNDVLELSWADTEERLQGAIQPDVPYPGQPLKVLLNVGSFYGEPFEGPITLTLREEGAKYGQTQTVKKGSVNWHAEFVPERAGLYQLDVSFRTTRLKVLHADFEVHATPVPRFVLWALVGVAAAAALGLGLRTLVRKELPAEPPPASAEPPAPPSPAPTSTQVSPPESSTEGPSESVTPKGPPPPR